MNDDISPRLTAMRDALVAEVGGAPRRPHRPSRAAVLTAAAAFLVGGGLTGGLTAAALPGADPDAAVESALATSSRYTVEDTDHGELLGAPVFRVGHGDTTIELGKRPVGADRVALSWTCLDAGVFHVSVAGGADDARGECTPGSSRTAGDGSTRSDVLPAPATGPARVTVSGGGSARWAVWASWAKAPTIAAPSALQDAETADGVVSQQEYSTAFNRLEACLAQAGQTTGVVPLSWYRDGLWTSTPGGAGPWYLYSTPSEGSEVFDTQCYPREFERVDEIWQAEHPMPEDPPAQPAG